MLTRLRQKSDRVELVEGVMDDFDLGREFQLVYVVSATIFAPLTRRGRSGRSAAPPAICDRAESSSCRRSSPI